MTQLQFFRLLNMRPVTVCVLALLAWVPIVCGLTWLPAGLAAMGVF